MCVCVRLCICVRVHVYRLVVKRKFMIFCNLDRILIKNQLNFIRFLMNILGVNQDCKNAQLWFFFTKIMIDETETDNSIVKLTLCTCCAVSLQSMKFFRQCSSHASLFFFLLRSYLVFSFN